MTSEKPYVMNEDWNLLFENQRWFDMLRWGTAAQTVNNYFKSETFYSEYTYVVNDIADWQTFLPIPVSVININRILHRIRVINLLK